MLAKFRAYTKKNPIGWFLFVCTAEKDLCAKRLDGLDIWEIRRFVSA